MYQQRAQVLRHLASQHVDTAEADVYHWSIAVRFVDAGVCGHRGCPNPLFVVRMVACGVRRAGYSGGRGRARRSAGSATRVRPHVGVAHTHTHTHTHTWSCVFPTTGSVTLFCFCLSPWRAITFARRKVAAFSEGTRKVTSWGRVALVWYGVPQASMASVLPLSRPLKVVAGSGR